MNALRRDAVAKALGALACAAVLIGVVLAGIASAGAASYGHELVAQGSDSKPMGTGLIVLFAILAIFVLILLGVILAFFKIWIRAYASGAHVTFGTLVGMRLRKVPASLIVDARIIAAKAGLAGTTTNDLETHFLAGGNVIQVVRSLVAAGKANIDLSFEKAAAIDLAATCSRPCRSASSPR